MAVVMAEDGREKAEKKPAQDAAAAITAFAMADPGTTRLYANGFTLGLTNADIYIILQMFGRPIGVVNLSYTLAKTLSMKLQNLVKDWEEKTGHPLATTDTIDHAFKPSEEAKK